MEPQLLVDDLLLHQARQPIPHLLRAVGRIEQERGTRRGDPQDVQPFEKIKLVARHEAGASDQVRRMDGLGAEAQVRDRLRAGLVRIVDEVSLREESLVLADDLDRVLVGAHRAVRAQAEKDGALDGRMIEVERRIRHQTEMGDIVDDAEREAMSRRIRLQLVERRLHQCRWKVLARQPITTTHDQRQRRARAATRPRPRGWRRRRGTRDRRRPQALWSARARRCGAPRRAARREGVLPRTVDTDGSGSRPLFRRRRPGP